jgi:hypothetical protein
LRSRPEANSTCSLGILALGQDLKSKRLYFQILLLYIITFHFQKAQQDFLLYKALSRYTREFRGGLYVFVTSTRILLNAH